MIMAHVLFEYKGVRVEEGGRTDREGVHVWLLRRVHVVVVNITNRTQVYSTEKHMMNVFDTRGFLLSRVG